jgi:hypothetical protein
LRGLVIVAIFALLAVLVARASAAPHEAGDDAAKIDVDLDDADSDGTSPLEPTVAPVDAPHASPLGFAVPVPTSRLVPPLAVEAVVAAAYRAASLEGDPAPSWRTRTRLAALVPWVSVHGGRDATWRDIDDPTLGYTDIYDVRATWHLDRLAFDPNEIRIEAMAISRRRDRRRVAAAAIHSYYEWLALVAAADTSVRFATRADEVHAELDAMTDGWFSKALANTRRSH